MEIFLGIKEINYIIKDYYKNVKDIKSCKVNITTENIKDKLKEVDLFHKDDFYYNVLFKAKITGYIYDSQGNRFSYEQELNEQGVKEIITNFLKNDYIVNNMKFGYNFIENNNSQTMFVQFRNVKADVVKIPTIEDKQKIYKNSFFDKFKRNRIMKNI